VTRAHPVAFVIAVAAVGVLGAVALAYAVEVRITTVRAAERGPSDAQLVALRPRLRRLVGYRSFQVMGEERRECPWQTAASFPIPGGRALHVFPKGMRDQAVVMQVKLLDGKRALVDTDIRLQNRGVMLFGVDQNASVADGALIIMLRAEE